MITHELEHVKSHHSLDVLYMEIVNVLFWFNPLIYLYKSAIKQTHEYLADAAVLYQTDKKMYGHILLRQSLSGIQIALAHSFFNSHIKKRIKMMYQKKSGKWAGLKYLLVLPLLTLIVAAFSLKEETKAIVDIYDFTRNIGHPFNEGTLDHCQSPAYFFSPYTKKPKTYKKGEEHFSITSELREFGKTYHLNDNVVLTINGKLVKEDLANVIDFSKHFWTDNIIVLSPEIAIEKYGTKGKFGAVEIGRISYDFNKLENWKSNDFCGQLYQSKTDYSFREKMDSYETLRMGDDPWEAEVYSEYIGVLEVRILNSKSEVVHYLDVVKGEKKLVIPLEYHSSDKSHQIRIVEKRNEPNYMLFLVNGKVYSPAEARKLRKDNKGVAIRMGKNSIEEYLSEQNISLPAEMALETVGILSHFYKSAHFQEIDNEYGIFRIKHSEPKQFELEIESDHRGNIELYFDQGHTTFGHSNFNKTDNLLEIKLSEHDFPKSGFSIKIGENRSTAIFSSGALRIRNGHLISDKKASKEWEASIIKPFQDQSLKADNSQKRLTSIHYVKHLYFKNPFSTEDMDLSKERVHKKENEILKLGPVFENFYAKTGLKKTFLWVINGKKILDIESFPLDFDRSYMIEHQEIYSPTLAKNTYGSDGKYGAIVMTGVEVSDLKVNESDTTTIYDPETFEESAYINKSNESSINTKESETGDLGIFTRIKDGISDVLGLGSYFKMSCHLPGLDYTVRHGQKDQLSFSFNSDKDREVEIYFDQGNGTITKHHTLGKGENRVAFPAAELPEGPFVIKLGADDLDCNCTFGVLEFNREKQKLETTGESLVNWEKKWGNDKKKTNNDVKRMISDSIPTQKPLLVINGKKFKYYDQISDVDPGDIDHINVYKAEESLEKYGDEGRFGVVEIITKGTKVKTVSNDTEKEDIQPLFVIDGEIQSRKRDATSDLDPDEIAEIHVLKGEKAFEKYGEKGDNGVVEIITKASNENKIKKNEKVVKKIQNGEVDTFIVFNADTFEESMYIHKPDYIKAKPEGSQLIKDIKLMDHNGSNIGVAFHSTVKQAAHVLISAIDGRVLARKTVDNTMIGSSTNFVHFQNLQLSNGIYIISIKQGEEVTSQKISLFR